MDFAGTLLPDHMDTQGLASVGTLGLLDIGVQHHTDPVLGRQGLPQDMVGSPLMGQAFPVGLVDWEIILQSQSLEQGLAV